MGLEGRHVPGLVLTLLDYFPRAVSYRVYLAGAALGGSYLPGEEGYRLPPPTEGEVEWLLQGAEALVGYRPRVASLWRGVRFRLSSFLFPVEGGSPSPGSAPRAFSTRLSSQRGLPKGFRLGACTRERSSREGPRALWGGQGPFVYRGKPLLLWVLESLRGAEERFIVANRPYVGFGVPVYPDLLPGADSLSGLHSALAHARFPWVAVAATDLPFLTRGFWDFLYEQARASPYPVVAVYSPEGHLGPLMALYHKDCLPQVERQIREGDFRLGRVVEALGATYVAAEEVVARFGERVYLNANRRADLP